MGILKAKKTNKDENDFSKKLNQQEVRVTRKIITTKEQFKKIKLISINQEKSLYTLLNISIKESIKNKINLKDFAAEGDYKNFSIDAVLMKESKLYCLKNDISLKTFLSHALAVIK
ncbi:hypothetical protein [Candidatus Thioglobus sp.]|uniref:hypothetical protein n=1 Tax=Candidatus Thioglobus sp. TaxID=2026721 RepID=UPI003D0CA59B